MYAMALMMSGLWCFGFVCFGRIVFGMMVGLCVVAFVALESFLCGFYGL
jgi:hypothetical protein